MEPILALFHFLMIFATVALLFGEFVLLLLEMTPGTLKLLSRIDLFYGLFAGLVIVSGLLRVFLGDQPASHWATSHAFWSKMLVFAVIGGISVIPTIRYIAWGKAFAKDGSLPNVETKKKTGRFVHIQLGLFLLLPVFAVLMAETK